MQNSASLAAYKSCFAVIQQGCFPHQKGTIWSVGNLPAIRSSIKSPLVLYNAIMYYSTYITPTSLMQWLGLIALGEVSDM